MLKCKMVAVLPVVDVVLDKIAVDGWNFIRLG